MNPELVKNLLSSFEKIKFLESENADDSQAPIGLTPSPIL